MQTFTVLRPLALPALTAAVVMLLAYASNAGSGV